MIHTRFPFDNSQGDGKYANRNIWSEIFFYLQFESAIRIYIL
jgi:hypothetical protein